MPSSPADFPLVPLRAYSSLVGVKGKVKTWSLSEETVNRLSGHGVALKSSGYVVYGVFPGFFWKILP